MDREYTELTMMPPNLEHRPLNLMHQTPEMRNVARQMVVVNEEDRTRTDISLKLEIEDLRCVAHGSSQERATDLRIADLHIRGKNTSR